MTNQQRQGSVVEMTLRTGSRGVSVARLQESLRSLGYDTAPDDVSIYGPRTELAVASFQQSTGLPVTGIVDNATLDAIRKALPTPEPSGADEAREAMAQARASTAQAEIVQVAPTQLAQVPAAKVSPWVLVGIAALGVLVVMVMGDDNSPEFSDYHDDYGIGPTQIDDEEEPEEDDAPEEPEEEAPETDEAEA